jgi:hypothetical protein
MTPHYPEEMLAVPGLRVGRNNVRRRMKGKQSGPRSALLRRRSAKYCSQVWNRMKAQLNRRVVSWVKNAATSAGNSLATVTR